MQRICLRKHFLLRGLDTRSNHAKKKNGELSQAKIPMNPVTGSPASVTDHSGVVGRPLLKHESSMVGMGPVLFLPTQTIISE